MPGIRNIIMLGPQGAGKGTQAKMLAKRQNMYHLEMGAMLRNIAKENTPLGKKVWDIIQDGNMVPHELVIELTKNTVAKVPRSHGVVFDGTPRRIQEIEPLETSLQESGRTLTHVFFIDVSREVSIQRLSNRRSCALCHKIYTFQEYKDGARCPACGGKLVQRSDDKPGAIEKRLTLYEERTKKVLEHYRAKGVLTTINGEQDIEGVYREIEKAL